MIKSILLLRCFYRLLQFTLFTNVLNLQNVDKRISMNRSRGGIGKLKLSILKILFGLYSRTFSFNASPNRHKKPTISGEIFGISRERKLKDLYTQWTPHYFVSYIKWIYDFTKALTHLLGEDREDDRKGNAFSHFTQQMFSLFFKNCILFVNNALMPHESLCLQPIHERRKIATTMETHFSDHS